MCKLLIDYSCDIRCSLDITNPHERLGGVEILDQIGNYLRYCKIHIMWNYYWIKERKSEPYCLEHKVNNGSISSAYGNDNLKKI